MTDTEDATDTAVAAPDWRDEVRELARQRDAVILAHNYQVPEIQDIADHVGDSLALSRIAARATESVIVFCGVHFMAETAKILSPDKTVLIPDERAGCSLAETISADELRAWKAEHPGAVVVSYVNTTAAVKAETDICCTSSNAVDVVAFDPRGSRRPVLSTTSSSAPTCSASPVGRTCTSWMGECHVHRGHQRGRPLRLPGDGRARCQELFIHPECGCATSALYLAGAGVVPAERTKILSTAGMVAAAEQTTAAKVLVATETGMLHQLTKANPLVVFEPVNRAAVCKYMKMITPGKLVQSLREMRRRGRRAERHRRAGVRQSVERMIALGAAEPHGRVTSS